MDIHDTALEAVHVQPAAVVTVTEPVPAVPVTVAVVGVTVNVQVMPAWVTVNVRPAIVSVPVRDDVEVLAATEKVTPALPFVFGPPPAVTVIQDALLTAVHWQSGGIVTDTTRVPPVAVSESLVDESDAVHGAAAWLIVCSFPPMAIVALRVDPFGFASTRYVTVPLPEPEAPVSTVIHETLDTAVQVQPAGTVTSTLELAPAATMLCVAGVSVASHVAPACVMTKG